MKCIIGVCGWVLRVSFNVVMMRIEVYVIYLFFILVRNENICVKLVFWKGLKFLGGDKKKYLLLIFI